jgi:hypothetical protein
METVETLPDSSTNTVFTNAPSGGGLELIASMQVDGLGRVTKLTDPNGNINYTVLRIPITRNWFIRAGTVRRTYPLDRPR